MTDWTKLDEIDRQRKHLYDLLAAGLETGTLIEVNPADYRDHIIDSTDPDCLPMTRVQLERPPVKRPLQVLNDKLDKILRKIEAEPISIFARPHEKLAARLNDYLSKFDPEEDYDKPLVLKSGGISLTLHDCALDALLHLGSLAGMKFDVSLKPDKREVLSTEELTEADVAAPEENK